MLRVQLLLLEKRLRLPSLDEEVFASKYVYNLPFVLHPRNAPCKHNACESASGLLHTIRCSFHRAYRPLLARPTDRNEFEWSSIELLERRLRFWGLVPFQTDCGALNATT